MMHIREGLTRHAGFFTQTHQNLVKWIAVFVVKICPNINHLLNHRKKDHVTSVHQCKNERSSSCKYGAQNCWYRHNSQTNNKENNVNQEVIEKLFNMMEQFTERIFNLENQTKLQ